MKIRDLRKLIVEVYKCEKELEDRINEILEVYNRVRCEMNPDLEGDERIPLRFDHINWNTSGWIKDDFLCVYTDGYKRFEFIPLQLLDKSFNLKKYHDKMVESVLKERNERLELERQGRYEKYLELKKEFEHDSKAGNRHT